jgi:hypothetical protein
VDSRLGRLLLGLSAAGYPLTQLAIRRFGRSGAVVTETACLALTIRDAAMVATGTPARLRRGPAALLFLELAAAGLATALGLRLVFGGEAADRAGRSVDAAEAARRGAVAALFALHTTRLRIYLRPDQGRRVPSPPQG